MEDEKLGYFEVLAKCGHVGRKHYVLKRFAVRAESAKEAARITRQIPRVKHHHKDAIRSVTAITPERFSELMRENSADPFFYCHSVQEQRMYEEAEIFAEEKFSEPEEQGVPARRGDGGRRFYCGKRLVRNPRKFRRAFGEEPHSRRPRDGSA
ncbi:MAG: hypothetical protein ACI4QA_04570 [Candidatus Spyradosoma sp.]